MIIHRPSEFATSAAAKIINNIDSLFWTHISVLLVTRQCVLSQPAVIFWATIINLYLEEHFHLIMATRVQHCLPFNCLLIIAIVGPKYSVWWQLVWMISVCPNSIKTFVCADLLNDHDFDHEITRLRAKTERCSHIGVTPTSSRDIDIGNTTLKRPVLIFRRNYKPVQLS